MRTKIKKFLGNPIIQALCRLILGGVFIYASIDKIVHPAAFAKIVYNYRLFPDFSIYLLAVIMPWIEMITGIFLAAGFFRQTAAIILSTLLLFFTAALAINLVRGLNFNCGCFSAAAAGSSDPVGLIVRDILLLIPGAIIIFFYKKSVVSRD